MRYLKPGRLYCFSPPVMIVTFIIEIALAIYVLARYKLTPVTRLGSAILLCLAIFQVAEYNVCEGALGLDSLSWARVGYVAITLLPPLGLHLATRIKGEQRSSLVVAAYASAAGFVAIFLLLGHGMQSQECMGNYVIFKIARWAVWPYAIYYYSWLVVGTIYSWRAAAKVLSPLKKKSLRMLSLGYISFIVPTTAAVVIDPSALSGIPSVMCGFAVIFAILVGLSVVPNYEATAQADDEVEITEPTLKRST